MPLEEPFEVKVAKSENHQSNGDDDDDDDDGDDGDDDDDDDDNDDNDTKREIIMMTMMKISIIIMHKCLGVWDNKALVEKRDHL